MGLNRYTPAYAVRANERDITDAIRRRFRSLRVTDEAGVTADTVELSLSDTDAEPMPVPPTGAELAVSIGYGDQLRDMGLYVVDEVELSGVPAAMHIRARAAPFEASKGGKSDLQSHKSRNWAAGTTLGAMAEKIAAEHGMAAVVSPSLRSITLPATAQARESDINLLLRVGRQYGAVVKPAGGRLVVAVRGDAKTASGADMAAVTLTPADGGDYTVTMAARDDAGTTVAFYRDLGRARRVEVSVGDGEPVERLRVTHPNAAAAMAAARARHTERARGTKALTYTVPGRPDLVAEGRAVLAGFRPGVDGEWLIVSAEHYIGPDGYRTTIRCEQPNSAEAVQAAAGASASEADAAGVEV